MRVRLGPVLYVDPPAEDRWRFRIQFLLEGDEPLDLAVTSASAGVQVGAPVRVAAFPEVGKFTCWSWPVAADRADAERRIAYRYTIGSATTEVDDVAIPARGALPNLAFFSCNGFSRPDLMHDVEEPNRLWERIHEQHVAGGPQVDGGFHLLVGGGDQVYADSLLYSVPTLRALWDKPPRKRRKYAPSPTFERQVLEGYVRLYAERWSQEEFARVAARVPGLFTWDDHDIFDGWGSYDEELNTCPAYQSIFAQAKKAFLAFQLGGAAAGARPPHVRGHGPHCLQRVSFPGQDCRLDVLLPDLRTDRTPRRVLSSAQWADLDAELEKHATDPAEKAARRHLLVVSSIPVVHMSFNVSEWLLRVLPGRQEIEDDLRDQWESSAHRGERDRLAMTLLDHAKKADCAVTLLSGDVHIGARGRLRSRRPEHLRPGRSEAWIDQVTSSAIVHPPPTALEMAFMRLVGGEGATVISNGVEADLLSVTPTSRYIMERNWVSGAFDKPASGKCRGWFQWQAESGPVEPQVVVEA